MIDFSTIELTPDEYKLLEDIKKKHDVRVSETEESAYKRLIKYGITEKTKTLFRDPDGNERREETICFGDIGEDYFIYYCNKLQEKQAEERRFQTTAKTARIALVLSVISLLAQFLQWILPLFL